jgi:glycosyltransferase involved in cell wall biosynthesis
MKIAMFDPYNGKFTNDMVDWWTNHGHEVKRETYYNPELVIWADIIWFDTCDNNLLSATNPDQALKDEWKYSNRPGAWDMHEMDLSNKKVIVRPIDIEVWQGHHAYENMWDIVNEVIFPAPHIQKLMMNDSRPQQGIFNQHVIPFGVDLNQWTFKERSDGFKIGIVSELWESKGVDLVLQIALRLKQIDKRYTIEWIGQQQMYHWGKSYFDDFVSGQELSIKYSSDFVEDLNEWWEDKNYVLHCSAKETYSYAVAEAMAKGIKPIFHRYYGADETWPNLTWSGIDEAIDLITEQVYDSNSYRQYLVDNNLDLESMMQSIEGVING